MMNRMLVFILSILILLLGGLAYADCTSPAAAAGSLEYFNSTKTEMYCDGTNWNSLKHGGIQQVGNLADTSTQVSSPSSVAAWGNYAYIGASNSFNIFDISDPTNPTLIHQVTMATPSGLTTDGSYVYVVSGNSLIIFDVTTPTNPVQVGSTTEGTSVSWNAITISGNYAYMVSTWSDTVSIADISNKTTPAFVGRVTDSTNLNNPLAIAASGSYAYVAGNSCNCVSVIDISTPTAPAVQATLTDGIFLRGIQSIVVAGNYAFTVSSGSTSDTGYFDVIDISNPSSPTLVKTIDVNAAPSLRNALNVVIKGNYAYVAGYLNSNQLTTIDISTPTDAKVLSAISLDTTNTRHMAIGGNTLVGVDGSFIYTLDISPKAVLPMTSSSTYYDANLNSAPSVSISGTIAVVLQGNDTLFIEDISNPASVTLLAKYHIMYGSADSVYYDGTYAYVVANGLQVVDLTNPSSPVLTKTISVSGGYGLAHQGNYLYLLTYNGLSIVDISTPGNPVALGSLSSAVAWGHGIAVSGNYAFITGYSDDSFAVVDISDPTTPTLVKKIADSTNLDGSYAVAVAGGYAYVSMSTGLTIIDISTPSTATVITNITNSYYIAVGDGMQVIGNYLYTASYNGGFTVSDISTPTAPVVNSHMSASTLVGLAIDGSYAYTVSQGLNPLAVYNIATPTAVTKVGSNYGYLGMLDSPRGIAGSGNYVYIAARGSNSVAVFDISDPTAPDLVANATDPSTLSSVTNVTLAGNYVYALAQSRLTIVNVSTPTAPSIVGSLYDNTNLYGAVDVALTGNYAIVLSSTKLAVVNITNKAAPATVGTVTNALFNNCRDISVSGNYAYLACAGSNSLVVVDLSTPTSPTVAGSLTDSTNLNYTSSIAIYGSYLYAGCSNNYGGGAIIDISNPAAPTLVGHLPGYYDTLLTLSGSTLYVLSQNISTIMSLDVSNPLSPKRQPDTHYSAGGPVYLSVVGSNLIGTSTGMEVWHLTTIPAPLYTSANVNLANRLYSVQGIDKIGTTIYSVSSQGILSAIDISDPTNPTFLGRLYDSRLINAGALSASGNYVYIPTGNWSYSFYVVDVSNPAAMTIVSSMNEFPNIWNVTYTKVAGNLLYMTSPIGGRFSAYDVTVPTVPYGRGSISSGISYPNAFDISGSYAYICGSSGMVVIDVSDPDSFSIAATLSGITCNDVKVMGSYVVTISQSSKTLTVFDMSVPTAPSVVGVLTDTVNLGSIYSLTINGNYAYIAGYSGFTTVDLSIPATPVIDDMLTGVFYKLASTTNKAYLINTSSTFGVYNVNPLLKLGACSTAGTMDYLAANNVFSYCNGSNYIPIGPSPGTGGPGCSSPTAAVGSLNYNTSLNKIQYCDGTSWVSGGP
jgi:hypothetical protein